MQAAAAELHATGSAAKGPALAAVALLDLGAGQPPRLLMVTHHLIADWVSWRMLLEDLELSYRRLGAWPGAPASSLNNVLQGVGRARLDGVRESDELWREVPYSLPGPDPVNRKPQRFPSIFRLDATPSVLYAPSTRCSIATRRGF